MKKYLARFTFRCGESEISFLHGVEVPTPSEAERKISDYLANFARGAEKEDGWWVYEGGEFAVRLSELLELPDRPEEQLEALWRELLPIR